MTRPPIRRNPPNTEVWFAVQVPDVQLTPEMTNPANSSAIPTRSSFSFNGFHSKGMIHTRLDLQTIHLLLHQNLRLPQFQRVWSARTATRFYRIRLHNRLYQLHCEFASPRPSQKIQYIQSGLLLPLMLLVPVFFSGVSPRWFRLFWLAP